MWHYVDIGSSKKSMVAKGRVGVYVPDHPRRNGSGYVPLSRTVIENKLGRYLEKRENVHHKNKNKMDDSEDNLEVIDCSDHARMHMNLGRVKRPETPQIIDLYHRGLGYKRISKKLGISHRTIRSIIIRDVYRGVSPDPRLYRKFDKRYTTEDILSGLGENFDCFKLLGRDTPGL